MKRVKFLLGAVFLIAFTAAFTTRPTANDVFIKSTDPLHPCILINCQQAHTAFACTVSSPVDGLYYKAGCVNAVTAFQTNP